ncbi:MAG: peptidase M23, partial [Synechocystis sp.]
MQSPSNVKDLSPRRNRYRRLCHLSLSGLLTASSTLWAVPGSTTGSFVIPDVAAPAAPRPPKP